VSRELDFERPLLELERQIAELRRIAAGRDRLASVVAGSHVGPAAEPEEESSALGAEIEALEARAKNLRHEVFSALGRWEIVQLSRHAQRPYTLDYVHRIFTDFVELHGDRAFADDGALVTGLARFNGSPVVVIGHQKGRTTKQNLYRNFGMARPEGYRKAMRVMALAERFNRPIITLIDTPGAYPGVDAEARGQAQAIAESLELMASMGVPIISVVIGEGGSGGALAVGVANRVLMLEYSTYSVISPEGCASILFRDASHAERAADALRLTAPDLLELGVIDDVIKEPTGGAHRDQDTAAANLEAALKKHLSELVRLSPRKLREQRYDRFRALGEFVQAPATVSEGDA